MATTIEKAPGAPCRRRGASARLGRARARAPRWAFLALVGILCAAGLRSILLPAAAAPRPARGGSPVDFAEQNFALGFARAYLTYDAARPEKREAALRPYIGAGIEAGAGFTPPEQGSQEVRWADVAQVQRPLSGGVAITVAAQLSDAREPVYLSVPVERGSGGAIFLAGYPSFVGAPLAATGHMSGRAGQPVSDQAVLALIRRALGNYLAGDAEDLSADLAGAATVTLPGAGLKLGGVEELEWVDGEGGGAVLATISATDARGGTYTLRYEVGLRRAASTEPGLGPGWRVTYVQAISQQS
ncbi:MAG TPA: conjugal transfer protein [Solirubrobacterales bacterium]|nr:conjugal transfer protein [Solirubrobacterales bacterium]